jgi:integrase
MTTAIPTSLEIAEILKQFYAVPPSQPSRGRGDLEGLADRFVELKRMLGHKYDWSAVRIHRFLTFLRERGVRDAGEISLEAMLAWASSREKVLGCTWARDLQAVSIFLDHLKVLGKMAQNPCKLLRRRPRRNFRPYIFTPEELGKIFYPANANSTVADRALIYFVIYSAGLRCCEALHLKIADFDIDQGTIFIRRSKFGKDRLLPLHPDVINRLQRFRQERRKDALPGEPFFLNAFGRLHVPHQFSARFREDLIHLGLYWKTRESTGVRFGSPRLHSLRHSFAIHRLLKWYRDGADVQSKLPLLSTYMGHSEIVHTQVYLRITALLLREADKRFAGRWEKEFPLKP